MATFGEDEPHEPTVSRVRVPLKETGHSTLAGGNGTIRSQVSQAGALLQVRDWNRFAAHWEEQRWPCSNHNRRPSSRRPPTDPTSSERPPAGPDGCTCVRSTLGQSGAELGHLGLVLHGPVHGRARRLYSQCGFAPDEERTASLGGRSAVGSERVHARLRRPSDVGRPCGRPVRAATSVPYRTWHVHWIQLARRSGAEPARG